MGSQLLLPSAISMKLSFAFFLLPWGSSCLRQMPCQILNLDLNLKPDHRPRKEEKHTELWRCMTGSVSNPGRRSDALIWLFLNSAQHKIVYATNSTNFSGV